MKLKRHDGEMRRYKRLLRRRKSALDVCTWIGVRIMQNGTKCRTVQSGKEDRKAGGE
jgi:hypothetical protein